MNTISEKKKALSEGMQTAAEVFDKKLTPELIEIYYRVLKAFSVDQIKYSFEKAVVECKWFPKPAELIEFIKGSPEDVQLAAHEAALVVIEAMRLTSHLQSVIFDPTTNAVIERCYGGWVELATSALIRDTKWFIKEFVAHYAAFHKTEVTKEGHLRGYLEMDNAAKGLDEYIPEPVDYRSRLRFTHDERKQLN